MRGNRAGTAPTLWGQGRRKPPGPGSAASRSRPGNPRGWRPPGPWSGEDWRPPGPLPRPRLHQYLLIKLKIY